MSLEAGTVFDGTLQDVLKALSAPGAFDAGAVNLISLEPIRSRLEGRWPKKRDQIWYQVERFLQRQFRPGDLITRVDEVTVMVAQPGRSGFAAQTACVRATAELMRTFIGEPDPATVELTTNVPAPTPASAHDFQWEPLSRDRLDDMLFAMDPWLVQPARAHTGPVLTRMGRELSLDLKLRPLWSLSPRRTVMGHYAQRSLSDQATGQPISATDRLELRPSDLVDIDCKALTEALALRGHSPSLHGALMAPVSYLTLTNSSTRTQLQQVVRQLAPTDRSVIVWELVDLEPGIPVGRLTELVSILRQQSRGVVCRMPLTHDNAEKVRRAGATLSAHPEGELCYTEAALLKLEPVLAYILKIVPTVMFQELPPELMPVAGHIGATHCSFAEAR